MSSQEAKHKNIVEKCEELRKKLQLLEDDKKAYKDSADWTKKQYMEKISAQRKENKELRKLKMDKLAASEHVVNEGLADCPAERAALRDKPAKVAIEKMDEKICDRVNTLNKLRFATQQLEKELNDKETEMASLKEKQAEQAAEEDIETDEQVHQRSLENQLEKTNQKLKEAGTIRRTYEQVRDRYEQDHGTHGNTLDAMEQELIRNKAEIQELKQMREDAEVGRDLAKEQLEEQEREVYSQRKQHEVELQLVRKEAEEKRAQHDRYERRIAASTLQADDTIVDREVTMAAGDDEEARISTYEEAFQRIKDATGVSDTQEVVTRFENQGETQEHLEELKKGNERTIERLREEKAKLEDEYEGMKYSGETSLSSGQQVLEDKQREVEEKENERDGKRDALQKSSEVLGNVRTGVYHLAEKLKNIKTSTQTQKSKISPTSDEFVLDQLATCEEKLLKLMEELGDRDLDEALRVMREEEFQKSSMKLPRHNTRIKLQEQDKNAMYDDDHDSGDDDAAAIRDKIKRQAQQAMDAKNRRSQVKAKKK